jgi:hypothetical protein
MQHRGVMSRVFFVLTLGWHIIVDLAVLEFIDCSARCPGHPDTRIAAVSVPGDLTPDARLA